MANVGPIAPLGSFSNPLRKKDKRTEKRSGKVERSDFSGILEQAHIDSDFSENRVNGSAAIPPFNESESIESLLDDVHTNGNALKRDPVLGPLNDYKTAVRRFIRYVLNEGFEVKENAGIRNPFTMKQKKYMMVNVIDRKLEDLAAHVMRTQSDQLEILRRIEEINGLLVDFSG